MPFFVGIDPGLTGAIGVLSEDGSHTETFDMPVVGKLVCGQLLCRGLSEIMLKDTITFVVIEEVGARPGQGVVSMFKFGRALGVVEGVVGSLRVPMMWARPQTWKKHFGLTGKEKDDSRRIAIERFPSVARDLSRVKDGGRAESLLLAQYGFDLFRQNQPTGEYH